MREPQTAANTGKDPSRAYEEAMKAMWGMGAKLIGNQLPMFKMMGLNMLTQLANPATPGRPPDMGDGYTRGEPRPGPGEGVMNSGRYDPNLGNELLDRWERNLNTSRMNPAEFMTHFNKNRVDRPGYSALTPTALVRYMAAQRGGPANPSPGFEYNPNPTYST